MKEDSDEECDSLEGDPLAVERTAMASERTLLSYVRTAIMLFATAVTLLYVVKDARMIVRIPINSATQSDHSGHPRSVATLVV